MNRSYCNHGTALVTATREERDGRVFLVKDCPDCGRTETLISSDAQRYLTKRSLDGEHEEPLGCMLKCLDCERKNQPSFVFVDITNRCNSNCPICINNTPSMGFLFEPPIEYFERMFQELGTYDPKPTVQLFGGEPTVRKDLFDIIALARSCGLSARVVTNGLKLADEEYCRQLIRTRATILFAYDGTNPETYRVLRGNEKHLAIKQKALENVARIGGAKMAFMACIAKGFNETEMPDLLRFCHERRDFVRGVYFLPLAQTWSLDELALEPERVTNEDLEILVNDCFPQERVDFVPAGVLGELTALMDCLHAKRPPFAGAHPNCESFYLLVSDGEQYVPLSRYLKGSLPDLTKARTDGGRRARAGLVQAGLEAAVALPARRAGPGGHGQAAWTTRPSSEGPRPGQALACALPAGQPAVPEGPPPGRPEAPDAPGDAADHRAAVRGQRDPRNRAPRTLPERIRVLRPRSGAGQRRAHLRVEPA